MFAPSSTSSTGGVIDQWSLKKSCHTFTADATNAYFHVDEDEECYVDPPADRLEQQGRIGESDLCAVATAKTIVRPEMRWNTLGRLHFMADCLEEQSFDRCDAAPQFLTNYELDVFIEVHMDDLHGSGPRLALDLVQNQPLTDNPFQNLDSERSGHEV